MSKKKKKEKDYVEGGRIIARFNTGTIKHRSLKDYTRKTKHKNKNIESE